MAAFPTPDLSELGLDVRTTRLVDGTMLLDVDDTKLRESLVPVRAAVDALTVALAGLPPRMRAMVRRELAERLRCDEVEETGAVRTEGR